MFDTSRFSTLAVPVVLHSSGAANCRAGQSQPDVAVHPF